MKSILTALLTFVSIICFAQAPQALNYQAVARTAQGQLIPAQNINVRFSVLENTVNGNTVYQETHTTTTNNFGLFTLAIGKGTPLTGTFNTVNWGSGDKFLKVEIAPQGNGNYELQGTTQLLSVPYALYAEKTRLIAGNAISITNGNTIAANYQPGVGIGITGNTIFGNYQPGVGINISGNTIAGNYQAGSGININGNVISSTGSGSNYWVTDANGMHATIPKIGIGKNSDQYYPLHVRQPNYGDGRGVAVFESDDVWHAAIAIKSNTANRQFSLIVGGPTNIETQPTNFSIYNNHLLKTAIAVGGNTNYIGIGIPTYITPPIKSALHVFTGDVNIEQIGSGIILKSPNGNCWRVTIDNSGNLVRTAIACP